MLGSTAIVAFRNLSIRIGIFRNIGITIALLCSAVAVGIHAADRLVVGAAQQDAEFHRVDESRTVDYRFLEAKRVIAAYLVSGADADRAAAEAAAAAVMEAIRAARSDDLAETRDRFAAIEPSLGDHLSAWTRVAELRSRQIAIAKDKVIPLGEKLKNDAQFLSSKLAALERNDLQAIAIKATEQFNSGRIAVTDLIHTTSDESLKAADTGFAVSASAGEINRAAEVMTGVSAQVSSEVKTVSTASGAALTSVGQVVSATEHLSSSITEIRRQMDDASDLARSVAGSAADTNQKIEAIAEAALRSSLPRSRPWPTRPNGRPSRSPGRSGPSGARRIPR